MLKWGGKSWTMMNLWSDVDIRPGGFPRNLDPVGERRSGSLGPTRAAVLKSQTIIFLSCCPFSGPVPFLWL